MAAEQIVLLAGSLFILIAVVGGGFQIREINIPRVPAWARVISLILGLAFVGPYLYGRFVPAPEDTPGPVDAGTGAIIYSDTGPDYSRHDLELVRIVARSEHDPPRVGDRIAIEFGLQNVGDRMVTFSQTFVGARRPSEENRDFGYSHQGLSLEPNQSVTVKANMIVETAGTWTFWPCYILANGSEDEESYCPTRWRAFPVRVE